MGATILQDLVVVMVIAAAATIIFYRLKQPVVLGYLLAGVIIGPNALGLISDADSIHGLSDLGIIFLMFAVGLEFDLKKLRKVGIAAAIAAAIEVSVMLAIGYQVGLWLGWGVMPSIFLGAVVSISSTSIIVKILTEKGKLKEEFSEVAFGILIIEDILAVVIVALLSSAGRTGTFEASLVGSTVAAVILFVFIFVSVGLVLVPRLIDVVSKFHVEEVLVITVVGLAFGAALLALNVGFSLALGAFLIGAIIAESKAVRRVEHKIVPLRDLFTAVFFVAVGMFIDPRVIMNYWQPILIVALATIVGKVVAVTIATYVVGYDGRTAFKTGTALGQIGEFSFIIAGLGLTLHVVNPELPPIAIAVCAITSLATGVLIHWGPKAADSISPRLPRWYVRPLSAYTRFAKKIFGRQADPLAKPNAIKTKHGARVMIYAAWLFGILIVAAYVSRWLGSEVGTRLSLADNATRAASLGFLGLIGLPLFVAFTKATEGYTYASAKAHQMSPRVLSGLDARHHRPKFIARFVSAVAAIALVAGAVRVAWGVHPLAIPNTWLLIPILTILCLLGWLLWHKLERVYEGMERTLNELMGVEEQPVEDERNRLLRERLPFGMDALEYRVRIDTAGSYTSLKALDLRSETGASILTVERGATVIHNPPGTWVLLPNDRIFMVGTHEQLERAQHYLDERVRDEDDAPIVERSIAIPPSSPAIGRTLRDLQVPESTGASFGFVQRADGSTMAAGPDVKAAAGDRVFVYGPEGSMHRVHERLKVKALPIRPPEPKRGPAR